MNFPKDFQESDFQKHILIHLVKQEFDEASEEIADVFKANNHVYTTRHDELAEELWKWLND